MPVERQSIVIVPVGEVADELLKVLVSPVEERFPGRTVELGIGLAHPDDALFPGRGQYLADPILQQLPGTHPTAERVIGVADLDLFAFGLSFVFGVAQTGGPAAVMALARLHSEFWGRPAEPQLLLERAIKEAVHELGHTYGLDHCEDPICVMYFLNTLEETDRKSDRFCTDHEVELRAVLNETA